VGVARGHLRDGSRCARESVAIMSKRSHRNHIPAFKEGVALAVIKGD
jgi:hypothetical protein